MKRSHHSLICSILAGVLLYPGVASSAPFATDMPWGDSFERNKAQNDLFQAISLGNDILVRDALNKGASVHTRDMYGNTPLTLAVAKGAPGVVHCLINAGADVNETDRQRQTPLMIAIQNTLSRHLVGTLIAAGARIDYQDPMSGNTALHYAVQLGDVSLVSTLTWMPSSSLCNMKNNASYTPLMLAVMEGHEKIVQILLRIPGIQINEQTAQGATPLILAAQKDQVNIAQMLLHANANVHFIDLYGKSALDYAIQRKNDAMIKLLADRR